MLLPVSNGYNFQLLQGPQRVCCGDWGYSIEECVILGMCYMSVARPSLQLMFSHACFLEMLMKAVIRWLLHGGLHKLHWPSFCCPDPWTVLTTGKAFGCNFSIFMVKWLDEIPLTSKWLLEVQMTTGQSAVESVLLSEVGEYIFWETSWFL